MKYISGLISLVLAAALLCPVSLQAAPGLDDLKLYAQSAVLMDGETGRVLYGKGADIVRPMASTTKIMTCILALESGTMEEAATVSKEAAAQPKVHLGVRAGESYRVEDLLYALMLESYNDAAVIIAEHVGGSREGFAALMNEKAEELGCQNTYFITSNGLDEKKVEPSGRERVHSTTAEELARIMRYCVMESPQREAFLKITGTGNYFFRDLSGKREFQCTNHNALLHMMDGVLSGKTGFTGGAGYSYVGALEDNGRTYIIALLGCGWPPHKTYKWTDARRLFSYGMEQYQRRDVFQPKTFPAVPVKGGLCWNMEEEADKIRLRFRPDEEKHLFLLLKKEEKVQITEKLPAVLQAPVEKNQQVGYVEYSLDGNVIKRFGVYAENRAMALTPGRAAGRLLFLFLGRLRLENGL